MRENSSRSTMIRIGGASLSSKGLPNAERKIEVSGALIAKLPDLRPSYFVGRNVGVAGKVGRIKIVSEIETQWSDRRLIARSDAHRMGSIVVVALQMGNLMKADILVRLVETPKAGQHLLRPRKNIAHVLENGETDVVIQVRHSDTGKAHFETVEEQGAATDGIPGEGIARPCLI